MFAKHACAKRAQQTRNVVRLCIEMQLKTNKYQKNGRKSCDDMAKNKTHGKA
jgi:hypothetical protein